MEYNRVKSEEHFINYLKLVARQENILSSDLLLREDYLRLIYNDGLADAFIGAINKNIDIMKRYYIYDWIERVKKPMVLDSLSTIDNIAKKYPYNEDFVTLCESLAEIPGIYNFWYLNKSEPLYIGKSKNLGVRIISSYIDKIDKYKLYPTKVSVIKSSYADAGIYELYFITQYQPEYNHKDKARDSLNLTISPIPEFDDGILVMAVQ